ncbi:MAG: efflux RND transporter periplasmic adaptor subunit [Saprospiraceae bacterium]|nr:efflux RND transporter periplasmic adaptor subunit [Saprospiraceae bacterium]
MRYILIILLSTICFFSNGCSDKKSEQTTQTATVAPKPDSLKVFILKTESVGKTVTLPAELTPNERINISAKIPAYIRQIKADIGTIVKRGQVLVILEAPELQAKTAEAAARAETVKAKMKTSYDLFQRNKAAAQVQGAMAAAEVERSQNQYLTDNAEYEAAQRYVASISEMQNYLTLTAPFDGVITARNMDVGSLAGNSDRAILVLENNQTLRLRVSVPEAFASCGLADKTIAFSLKAEPTQVFKATLARKSQTIDPTTRTEIWEFDVPNSHKTLKSGMFANAKLALNRPANSITVPFSAITTSLERKFIIRVHEGKTEWVDIQQGLTLADKVEIFGNIAVGDTIVSKSSEEIKPETKVIVKF